MKKNIIILLSVIALNGCSSNKEKITIQSIPNASPDEVSNHEIKEERISESTKNELIPEISTQQPIEHSQKFKIDSDDNIPIINTDKPIMIAITAPMSGKYDMIGNAIMDGAHLGLINLFEKYKIPVRLTAIDTGSGIEDMEFNISKLDETQFDVILGITSNEQEQFIKLYLNNFEHKPKILSFNVNSENSCIVSPQNQLQAIKNYISEKVYVLVPNNHLNDWKNVNATVIAYNGNDLQNINQEFMNILSKISKDNNEKVYILFTENSWKLQKLMSQIDSMQLTNNIHIILSTFSNLNSRMESLNQKRHKFGNISVLMPNQSEYNNFLKEFYSLHKRRPLEIAFLAYNAIQQLKHGDIENSCKPELQLLNGNAKNNS